MTRAVLATGNAGKLREFAQLLAGAGLELVPQSAFAVPPVAETGLTFVENALIKARHAAAVSGLPAIADDSGLEVAALGGAPGVYSARYSGVHGDDAANNDKLLKELLNAPNEQRDARFISVLAMLRHADDPVPMIALGAWPGRILHAPRGEKGFGYDPLFLDPESGLSAAEMSAEAKNAVSHRARAFAALLALVRCEA